MLGPWINSSALLLGGSLGAALSCRLPQRVREALPLTCGIISIAIGMVMINKIHVIPAVVLALLIGAFIGEMASLELRLGTAIGWLQMRASRLMPYDADDERARCFVEKYVMVLVLFCVSGMGIFGSIQEGMTGETTILLTKSALDFFTALIFATDLGISIVFIAIPQVLIQGTLFLSAVFIAPWVTPGMQADFSACGGVIMLATGLRICGIKAFPIVNMLPALLLVMPLTLLCLSLGM